MQPGGVSGLGGGVRGNTEDPATVDALFEKLRARFGLLKVVPAGDRGMLTEARARADVRPAGLDMISVLRCPPIRSVIVSGAVQPRAALRNFARLVAHLKGGVRPHNLHRGSVVRRPLTKQRHDDCQVVRHPDHLLMKHLSQRLQFALLRCRIGRRILRHDGRSPPDRAIGRRPDVQVEYHPSNQEYGCAPDRHFNCGGAAFDRRETRNLPLHRDGSGCASPSAGSRLGTPMRTTTMPPVPSCVANAILLGLMLRVSVICQSFTQLKSDPNPISSRTKSHGDSWEPSASARATACAARLFRSSSKNVVAILMRHLQNGLTERN